MAHHTWCTRTPPARRASTDTSTTMAAKPWKLSCAATPRKRPWGGPATQLQALATASSVPRSRGWSSRSICMRNSSGSCFCEWASSSAKHSLKKALCECPTERQEATDTGVRVFCQVTRSPSAR